MGRPRLIFDLRQVEELGKIQSTQGELAAVLGCGLSTVKDRIANDEEFAAAYERGREAGKSSLRRLQWKAALGGNITMQIWLGKQYLGQSDRQTVEQTGEEDSVRIVYVDVAAPREAGAGVKTPLPAGPKALPASVDPR
jgi:hypothetical protein